MDDLLIGLTTRQAMLLLAAVAFGNQNGVEALAFLPSDEFELLRYRAEQIMSIPRAQRMPFLAQHIRRLVKKPITTALRYANPEKVAEALSNERPAMVEMILRGLPAAVADDVRRIINHPTVELRKDVRQEIRSVIRNKFEQKLAALSPEPPTFSMVDLISMPSLEIEFLADVLGARQLSLLIAPLSQNEQSMAMVELPPEHRHRIKAQLEQITEPMDQANARSLLTQISFQKHPRQAMRTLGLRVIARACLSYNTELASRIIENHRDAVGQQLSKQISHERQHKRRPSERIVNQILSAMQQLAIEGLLEWPSRVPNYD